MDEKRMLSTDQVAARLGVSRETVNQYAQALEATTGTSLKVKGGARRFGAAQLETFRRMRRILRDAPEIGIETACQQVLEMGIATDDDETDRQALEEELRAGLTTLEHLRSGLEALLEHTEEFTESRSRLEGVMDDCATEVMEIGARAREWPRQAEGFRLALKEFSELQRRTDARLEGVNALLDRHIARVLEKSVPVWIACGVGAFLLGFVVLPWLMRLLGWRC